jgi:2'-5' RNA ligase
LNTYRLFIAADFPNQVIEKIKIIQESLKEGNPTVVHWTNPENIHLTLKFLGETKLEKAQSIKDNLDNIAIETKPFGLKLEGIGSFPNWRNPRIVWIGVEKSESLHLLVRQIEANMKNLGCASEIKSFSPHLTIGRVRENSRQEAIQILEKKCVSFATIMGITQITEIHLYKSDLYRSGPVYESIHTSMFIPSQ